MLYAYVLYTKDISFLPLKTRFYVKIIYYYKADEIKQSLNKWKKYFNTKEDEFSEKKKRLTSLHENLENRKLQLVGELNQNYDKIINIYSKEKENIEKEIDELYKIEYESLSLIKTKITQLVLGYNDFLKKYKEKFSKLGKM